MTDSVQEGLERIAGRLAAGGTVSGLRQLTGGASQQTWSFDLVSSHGTEPLILRQSGVFSGGGSEQNITLDVEAQLVERVARGGVPVPRVRYVLEPGDGLGQGYIMQRVEGEALPQRILGDPAFDDVRPRLAEQCGEILGRIHRVVTDGLTGLRRATPEQEVARQLEEYRGHGPRRPVFELALRWLQDHVPPSRHLALVHGDFRNGNLLVGPDGIRAVLDWELAYIGDPMEDLGWLCVNSWRFGRDLPVGGFGTREALFAGYQRTSGERVDPDAVAFWEVYGSLKWGVICRMMAHSYRSGADRSLEPAVIGRRASEAEIDLLHLLAPLDGGT